MTNKWRAVLISGAVLAVMPQAAKASAVITNGNGIYGGFMSTGEMGFSDATLFSLNGAGGRLGSR